MKDGKAESTPNGAGRRLALDVIGYSVMRITLVIVVGAVIFGLGKVAGVEVPFIVVALFALIIALPLGMVLFKAQRTRVNDGIAAVDGRRKVQRDDLRSRLRGTSAAGQAEPSVSAEPADKPADAGGDKPGGDASASA